MFASNFFGFVGYNDFSYDGPISSNQLTAGAGFGTPGPSISSICSVECNLTRSAYRDGGLGNQPPNRFDHRPLKVSIGDDQFDPECILVLEIRGFGRLSQCIHAVLLFP